MVLLLDGTFYNGFSSAIDEIVALPGATASCQSLNPTNQGSKTSVARARRGAFWKHSIRVPKISPARPHNIRPIHGCLQDNIGGGIKRPGSKITKRATAGAGYGICWPLAPKEPKLLAGGEAERSVAEPG